jgi:hypothetical protein
VDSYNSRYALITITVTDAHDAVAFTKSTFEVGEGGSVQTVLTASPAGASTRATYTIVGNDALSVDENGVVIALFVEALEYEDLAEVVEAQLSK